jgi:hypothetical protein
MRVLIAVTVLAASVLGGCARKSQADYASPLTSEPVPHLTKASWVTPAPLTTGKSQRVKNAVPPSGTSAIPSDERVGSSAGEEDPEAKFKAAQAKAHKLGVHQLTHDDIEGLSFDQIRQLRGYCKRRQNAYHARFFEIFPLLFGRAPSGGGPL